MANDVPRFRRLRFSVGITTICNIAVLPAVHGTQPHFADAYETAAGIAFPKTLVAGKAV